MRNPTIFLLPLVLVLAAAGPCSSDEVRRDGKPCSDEDALVCGTTDSVGNVVALQCVEGVFRNAGDCPMCSPHGDNTSFVSCSDGIYSAVLGTPCDANGIGVCTFSRQAELICVNGEWDLLLVCREGTTCGFNSDEQVLCK